MRNGFLTPKELVAYRVYAQYAERSEYERQLAAQPFWRFRRRQTLQRALERARAQESTGLELLGGRGEAGHR